MKMYDKNGNFTMVAKEIFNSGLERMRSGESPIKIANDLQVQIKLVKYEGDYLNNGRLSQTAQALRNVGAIFYSINRESRNGLQFHEPRAFEPYMRINPPIESKVVSVTIIP